MTYQIFFSIIIPVFNGEKFIKNSVLSYDKNKYRIEIIYINDGSTDNSLTELRNIEMKYNYIKIINQSHYGAGKARNEGLKIASGRYVIFLDIDDYFSFSGLRMVSWCPSSLSQ